MSKLDIGVGEEFPLDEGRKEEDRHAWKQDYRAQRLGRRGHRHANRDHHHRHGRRGFLHLPLLIAVAGIAALIGAGKVPALATDAILALAVLVIVLAIAAHFWLHRRWHADRHTQ